MNNKLGFLFTLSLGKLTKFYHLNSEVNAHQATTSIQKPDGHKSDTKTVNNT
jgi:hypothetical protein